MSWTKKNNSVVLSNYNIEFLNKLALALPFDIVVTSGRRNAAQQVNAVFTKLDLGDDIKKIYKNQTYAQKMIDYYNAGNKNGAIAYQEDYWTKNNNSHGAGIGIDIRTNDKTEEQIQLMKRTADAIGVQLALIERTPPHLHITQYKQDTDKKKLLILPLIGAAAWILLKSYK